MMIQPSDFVGTFTMSQGSVQTGPAGQFNPEAAQRIVTVGNTLYIGTGPAKGWPGGDDDRSLGAVIMNGDIQVYPDEGIATLTFDEENRVFQCAEYQPLVLQLSLYYDTKANYKTVYGLVTWGDPENVGVWGANDSGGGPTPEPG